MDINNKTAIITGGASGLGRATAEELVRCGANVALFDLNEEAGSALADALGGNAMFCAVNVTDDGRIAAGIQAVMETFGQVHICVNCAGRGGGATKTLGRGGRFPMELFRDVININLVGTFSVLSQAAEKMADNDPDGNGERGVIINTASIAAYEGQKGQVAYSASKAGLVGITLPIARDLAYYGIRIATIAPGVFETPLIEGIPEPAREALGRSIPFPARLGDTSEFAALARHIVENPYINGETIRLDGALRMD
ncbi:MAG: SDR family NAD(P)-dependent oxidoreductase [Gammaproteobacteria bacterium]|nr:SDR family NAD(P)-dependent oxidoreductase [Gammaproteobacteria bacterium]